MSVPTCESTHSVPFRHLRKSNYVCQNTTLPIMLSNQHNKNDSIDFHVTMVASEQHMALLNIWDGCNFLFVLTNAS